MTEELEKLAAKIDEAVYGIVETDSGRLFKNPPKDLASWYKSIKKEASKMEYASTLRTKCTFGGDKASFKCWDGDRRPLSFEDIKNRLAQLHVWVRSNFEGRVFPK